MTEWKLQSYPEMLQALYQLKAATRIYRQERTAENAALMLEKFPAAAMAAAEDAAAWKRVMSGAAAGVLERAADGADVDKLAALGRNDRFYTLFAHEDAAAFQKFLAEREKNKADIAGNECPDSAAKLSREFNRCLGCRAKPCEKACPLEQRRGKAGSQKRRCSCRRTAPGNRGSGNAGQKAYGHGKAEYAAGTGGNLPGQRI